MASEGSSSQTCGQWEVEASEDRPAEELRKLREDVEECVRLFEESKTQPTDPPTRSASIVTVSTLPLHDDVEDS